MDTFDIRPIQEIFDAVIDSGIYAKDNRYSPSCSTLEDRRDYMCGALAVASAHGVISDDERLFAKHKIDLYLAISGRSYLKQALEYYNLPSEFSDRLAIYRNWANRPNFTEY